MNRPILKAVLYAAALVAVGLLGLWIAQEKHPREEQSTACSQGREADYWYDPMRPDQHFDKPGKSPFMDMQLVPKCADGGPSAAITSGTTSAEGSIAIDPRIVQSLGVRLAPVERGTFERVVDTVGIVAVDEHRIETVQVRSPGWVEELGVRAAGDPVRRGQLLAGVYSPDLLAAQQELLLTVGSQDSPLIDAARERLRLAGVSDAQIARIEKSGKPERRVAYYAPFDGYVMELGVRQGSAVELNTLLFQLAELSTVWITAEVPELQAAWIKAGDPARAEVQALPGQSFEGRIDYVYPELMPATRTLKLRVVVPNATGTLRPGMYAAVHLRGASTPEVLMVPSEAVIRTGLRSVVIVAEDETHFRPALVRVGSEYGGQSEILTGVDAGQQVVASGQFLIDSEANLRGALARLESGVTKADDGPSEPMAPMPRDH